MTDEDQRALAVKTVAAVFMPIACISVMLRCYVRGKVVKGFGWDDGAMVVAAVMTPSTNTVLRSKLTFLAILCYVLCVYDWWNSLRYRAEIHKP